MSDAIMRWKTSNIKTETTIEVAEFFFYFVSNKTHAGRLKKLVYCSTRYIFVMYSMSYYINIFNRK